MKQALTVLIILLVTLTGCVEKGIVDVDLSQGYSEFTIQSEHNEVESVSLKLTGESPCEVSMLVSKQKVDTIGTGVIDFKKTYPWRAGELKIKVYSPRCSTDGKLRVRYAFKR